MFAAMNLLMWLFFSLEYDKEVNRGACLVNFCLSRITTAEVD